MKLLWLYGPPGTGKLTVARELAALTGWRLFHNHLTVDLAKSLFDFGTPEMDEYRRFLRQDAFARAARADVNLIFTFWYSKASAAAVALYQQTVEDNGGEVLFVKLHCRPEILRARVQSDSRQNWKIDSLKNLEEALENTDLAAVIPGTGLELDNSDLEPAAAARVIVQHFGIELSQPLVLTDSSL